MSDWKLKSEKNIKGAELLIKNSLCSSSVHCSYYSNVQLMLHILFADFGKTEKEIESEAKQGSVDEQGYHNWLKNTITRELTKRDFMIVRDFNNFFGQLKALRIKGDYKNSLISESKAIDAVSFSRNINEILQEKFSI
ncbi:MAG: hypothetical protein M0Q90_13410 [Bacteroidales bacterium]|nr:hypothetical protein [Bacteroidales bacterium]